MNHEDIMKKKSEDCAGIFEQVEILFVPQVCKFYLNVRAGCG